MITRTAARSLNDDSGLRSNLDLLQRKPSMFGLGEREGSEGRVAVSFEVGLTERESSIAGASDLWLGWWCGGCGGACGGRYRQVDQELPGHIHNRAGRLSHGRKQNHESFRLDPAGGGVLNADGPCLDLRRCPVVEILAPVILRISCPSLPLLIAIGFRNVLQHAPLAVSSLLQIKSTFSPRL